MALENKKAMESIFRSVHGLAFLMLFL